MKAARTIIISLVLGILFGWVVRNMSLSPELNTNILQYLSMASDIFIKLIKMIVAPLIFASLTLGVVNIGDNAKGLGMLFGRVLGLFVLSSICSLFVGWFVIDLFKPGLAMVEVGKNILASSGVEAASKFDSNQISLAHFVQETIPDNVFSAFSGGHIIQIVIFSLFFGVALTKINPQSRESIRVLLDGIMHAMFAICNTVMKLVPIAVFASIAGVIIKHGFGVLETYLIFILEYYLALIIVWMLIYLLSLKVVGRSINKLISSIIPPLSLSFATSSSEVAYPAVFEALEEHGVREKISSFVMPMGYSFNMIGSMVYFSFAIIFITQVFGINISFTDKLYIFFMLLITSKGIAGVPRASIMVISSAVTAFHFPEASILLLLPIDAFADMGRSATNVYANAVMTTFIDKWHKD
ncbi:MAG: dicarboxylate/amino acid:cation symporter [Burkholderiales bacterium]|nr:dicarboxylate/amino acid:cation symporter [Burkholderiales bacterium]